MIPNNATAAMAQHKCAALGCKRYTSIDYLMCARCWNLVPRALQTEVWATLHSGRRKNAHPSDEYLNAVKRAVQAVEEHRAAPRHTGLFPDAGGPE
jgi:hypothetical protein